MKLKIRKNDTVRVLRGKDRGKSGKVLAVFPSAGRMMVEGVNMVYKHVRAKGPQQKGQRVTVAAPLPVANVQLVCPQCKKGTRVLIRREGGERVRVCRHCQSPIPTI